MNRGTGDEGGGKAFRAVVIFRYTFYPLQTVYKLLVRVLLGEGRGYPDLSQGQLLTAA